LNYFAFGVGGGKIWCGVGLININHCSLSSFQSDESKFQVNTYLGNLRK
jgi:hypothetical protein